MEADFWLERWQSKQIGFHQDEVNRHLERHWPGLGLAPGSRVLVPLCGKSRDLLWLAAQGHAVTGVELSEIAVRDFFAENGLEPLVRELGPFREWRCDEIRILQGDFFDLDGRLLGAVAGVYDRAALVALPARMRGRYVAHLYRLLRRGTRVLLVSMEYPQEEMEGPPFSVSAEEIRERYGAGFIVEALDRVDILDENPRFRERGLSSLVETLFRLLRR